MKVSGVLWGMSPWLVHLFFCVWVSWDYLQQLWWNKKYDKYWDEVEGQVNNPTIEVQCFPFYSVLLASNRVNIDYFSLDIEGFEMQILKTIPWDKVDIKV